MIGRVSGLSCKEVDQDPTSREGLEKARWHAQLEKIIVGFVMRAAQVQWALAVYDVAVVDYRKSFSKLNRVIEAFKIGYCSSFLMTVS